MGKGIASKKSFISESVKNALGPDVWWPAMKIKSIDVKLFDFALHLMNCCASLSSIDRLFSKFGLIQNRDNCKTCHL